MQAQLADAEETYTQPELERLRQKQRVTSVLAVTTVWMVVWAPMWVSFVVVPGRDPTVFSSSLRTAMTGLSLLVLASEAYLAWYVHKWDSLFAPGALAVTPAMRRDALQRRLVRSVVRTIPVGLLVLACARYTLNGLALTVAYTSVLGLGWLVDLGVNLSWAVQSRALPASCLEFCVAVKRVPGDDTVARGGEYESVAHA